MFECVYQLQKTLINMLLINLVSLFICCRCIFYTVGLVHCRFHQMYTIDTQFYPITFSQSILFILFIRLLCMCIYIHIFANTRVVHIVCKNDYGWGGLSDWMDG